MTTDQSPAPDHQDYRATYPYKVGVAQETIRALLEDDWYGPLTERQRSLLTRAKRALHRGETAAGGEAS